MCELQMWTHFYSTEYMVKSRCYQTIPRKGLIYFFHLACYFSHKMLEINTQVNYAGMAGSLRAAPNRVV